MSTVAVVVLLAAVVRRGVRGMGVVGWLRGPQGERGGGVGAVHGGSGTRHARRPPAVRLPESGAVGVGFEVGVSSRAGDWIARDRASGELPNPPDMLPLLSDRKCTAWIGRHWFLTLVQ